MLSQQSVAVALCLKVISNLHKGCVLYDEWKSENRPTFKPWLHPEQSCLPLLNQQDIVTMKYSTTCSDLLSESNATEDQIATDVVESWVKGSCYFWNFVPVYRSDEVIGEEKSKNRMCVISDQGWKLETLGTHFRCLFYICIFHSYVFNLAAVL